MPLRLATLLAAQLFDAGTFIVMVRADGPTSEANPLTAGLLLSHGLAILVLLKLAIVVLVGALTVAGVARNGGRGAWAFVAWVPLGLAITFGVLGGVTNAATILN